MKHLKDVKGLEGVNEVVCGDCLEGLKKLPNDCVDSIVTDPPYGYSFMGKDWDKAVPSVETWQECLRVLKPGGFAFIMSAPRQDVLSQMIVRIGEAGFDTSFTSLYWTYASGFPKAMNIGKMVDKRNERVPEYEKLAKHLKSSRLGLGLKQSEISRLFPSKSGGLTGCVSNWELGDCVPTIEQWEVLKNKLNLDDRFDALIKKETKRFKEAEREVIKERSRKPVNDGTGLDYGKYGTDANVTKPETPEAKALDGSYGGYQPKPAVEIIIVAMKPLSEKTYVDQAMKNRKGITWLDDVRIPFDGEVKETQRSVPKSDGSKMGKFKENTKMATPTEQGRFPANLLVSDDVLNDGDTRKSGNMQGEQGGFGGSHIYGDSEKAEAIAYADSGSFSRYFDLDKWANQLPFLMTPKASKGEKNEGCGHMEEKHEIGNAFKTMPDQRMDKEQKRLPNSNHHPTVKPIKLMSYLIALGSREGDLVLDPFMGSWTTAKACQQMSRKFLGFELSEEYCQIGEARMIQETLF